MSANPDGDRPVRLRLQLCMVGSMESARRESVGRLRPETPGNQDRFLQPAVSRVDEPPARAPGTPPGLSRRRARGSGVRARVGRTSRPSWLRLQDCGTAHQGRGWPHAGARSPRRSMTASSKPHISEMRRGGGRWPKRSRIQAPRRLVRRRPDPPPAPPSSRCSNRIQWQPQFASVPVRSYCLVTVLRRLKHRWRSSLSRLAQASPRSVAFDRANQISICLAAGPWRAVCVSLVLAAPHVAREACRNTCAWFTPRGRHAAHGGGRTTFRPGDGAASQRL